MTVASIAVHIDSSPRATARIALARRLAERSGASLTGIFAETSGAHRVGLVATWPSEDYVAAAAAARATFEEIAGDLGPRARVVDVNRGGEQEVVLRTTDIARHFDLVVLGQSEAGTRVPVDLPEQTILESGRPVLVVPSVGTFETVGRRPLFAWHPSRGAARALHDALPLVTKAADALVIEAGRPSDGPDEFADLVVAALAAHGVTARFHGVVVEEVKLMDTLLNAASDHGSDLLAVGAFDGAGFGFGGRGAGTRYLLRHMTLPVLFSH